MNLRRSLVSFLLAASALCCLPAHAQTQPAPPKGPVEANWNSIRAHYKTPAWFTEGKFGIFMHWGIYSVPARQSEWYVRYMYGGNAGIMNEHIAKYGPLDKFGYKDFIPKFTAAKWDPDAWAELFRKSGARYIIPSAEHHDGFSLWDSDLNKFNAKNMGPKRDLIGDLGKAVRAKGLKYGVSNHSLNHFDFVPLNPQSDQSDPTWAEFYQVDRSPAARQKFNDMWVKKNYELIDKYQPDMIWFDGLGGGASQEMRTSVAAYYFNRALEWGKAVSISGKGNDFPAGSILDYERQGRIHPRELKTFPWQVDDPMGSKFAYVEEIKYKDAALLIRRLIDCVSMNGNYLLNISPKADGTIPQEQQDRLLAMGKWLDINGEAIYGTKPWARYGEGPYYSSPEPAWRSPGPDDPPNESFSSKEVRFTTKGDTLYAILMDWPGETATVTSLGTDAKLIGKIEKVELLGHKGEIKFTQNAGGLVVTLPAEKPCDVAFALKIISTK